MEIIREFLLSNGKWPSVRQLQEKMEYRSPRSISILLENLLSAWLIIRNEDGGYGVATDRNARSNQTVNVPLVGDVACWAPIFAEENIEAMIPVSTQIIRDASEYFFLRARGDSMDKLGIEDGGMVLIHKQQSANNGDIILALINDSATLKELRVDRERGFVSLIPHSANPIHQPIVLEESFLIQGVVVRSFWKF